MAKLTVRDLDAKGKEVLMRVDFNVPLKDGEITNDARIVAALPTIKFLLDQGARLGPHLPSGPSQERTRSRFFPEARCRPPFRTARQGSEIRSRRHRPGKRKPPGAAMKDGDVVLLENVRFYPGEKKNDPEFAKALLGNATLFVNDAFGTAHRAHASTEGVTLLQEKTPWAFLIDSELEYLEGKLENPEKALRGNHGGRQGVRQD